MRAAVASDLLLKVGPSTALPRGLDSSALAEQNL